MKSNLTGRAVALLLSLTLLVSLLTVPALAAVTKITLNKDTLTLKVNEGKSIEASVEGDGNKNVTWSVNDAGKDVVELALNGNAVRITGKKVGTATVTATSAEDASITASCAVTVEPIAVTGVTLKPDPLEVAKGGTGTLIATVSPSGATNKTITWESGDESIATVDADGKVTGVDVGETTVTVTTDDGDFTAECAVKVSVPVSSVKINGDTDQIIEGNQITLTATVSPDDAMDSAKNPPEVTWRSSRSQFASITPDPADSKKCVVTGLKKGTSTITVVAGEESATYTVYVIDDPTARVELDKTSLTLSVDEQKAVSAAIRGDWTGGDLIRWTSSDTSKVTVSSEFSHSGGNVTLTGKGEGAVTVTAQSEENPDLKAVCTINVTAVAPTAIEVQGQANSNMRKGSQIQLTAAVTPANAVKTVKWISSDTSVATVDSDGVVTAVAPGSAVISAETPDGKVKSWKDYPLEVNGLTVSLPSGAEVRVNDRAVQLEYAAFGDVRLGTPTWTSSNSAIATVNASGLVTGRAEGRATITASVRIDREEYSAECEVNVGANMDTIRRTGSDGLEAGKWLSFEELRRDLNNRSQSRNEAGLDYITNLSVPTEQGTLYYGYTTSDTPNHGVGGAERFYYDPDGNQMDLSDVSFVPAGDFDGMATISYIGYGTNDRMFAGQIQVEVKSTGDVAYSTAENRPVTFSGEDFADMCLLKTNGRALSYVTFEQPAASRGTLYYNYSTTGQYSQKVDPSTQYRLSGNNQLDRITFLPAENYTGTVRISYRCTDTSGSSYSGTVSVNVFTPAGSSSGGVSYNTGLGEEVDLVSNDFNEVSQSKNGYNVSYIQFTELPASGEGTLYYNYRSSTNFDSRVSVNTRYYRSSTPRIGNITFVPAAGFSGTVSIPYNGYDTNGGRYSDTLVIRVNGSSTSITYKTTALQAVAFNAADFNEVCQERMGTSLNHVRFQLPSTSVGRLYYNYRVTSSRNTEVKSNTNYYRTGSNLISNVYFVPAAGYTGTTAITYTGYTTSSNSGNSYTGNILISVDDSGVTSVRYSGSSLPVNLWASDFQSVCSNTTGGSLSYIQFTSLPTTVQGQLRLNYVSPTNTGSPASLNTSYFVSGTPSISSLSFVPKAEYQGPVVLTYTAHDSMGRNYTSTVTINLSNSYCSTPFSDMSTSWAKSSVEFLRQYGVVGGYGNNTYGPGDMVTRGQFALMLCRAFGFSTTNSNASFPDIQPGTTYAGAIATAKTLGIVNGAPDGLFYANNAISRQEAMAMICRGMQAAGRNVPLVSADTLNGYVDNAQVAAFARGNIASLLQLGVVRGNGGYLQPRNAITRAEMAVILHRVLTL